MVEGHRKIEYVYTFTCDCCGKKETLNFVYAEDGKISSPEIGCNTPPHFPSGWFKTFIAITTNNKFDSN